MKYKEKEKLWLQVIKNLSKSSGWKFKGYFIYKIVNDFFFCSFFYVSMKENAISGWLGYKPLNIDNVFWEIVNEQPNKRMPLSFRAEAAFCVREITFFNYKIDINDILNPENEISELLERIDSNFLEKSRVVQTTADFQSEMLINEKLNSVGIITGLIEQGKIQSALNKISEYQNKEINSGFGFGDKDFYDLAKNYCEMLKNSQQLMKFCSGS